MNKNLTFWWFR